MTFFVKPGLSEQVFEQPTLGEMIRDICSVIIYVLHIKIYFVKNLQIIENKNKYVFNLFKD